MLARTPLACQVDSGRSPVIDANPRTGGHPAGAGPCAASVEA